MLHVTLVSRPSIDLDTIFSTASAALGYSISKSIDACQSNLTPDAKMLAALASFNDETNLTARQQIQQVENELFFLHYVFLVYSDGDTLSRVREWTRLSINSNVSINGNPVYFVGGTLDEWRAATVQCCVQRAPFNLRLLFDRVILSFESIGLADVWATYRKKALPDKTFLIEDKR